MTDLSDILAPDGVLPALAAPNKRALMTSLGAQAATLWGLDSKRVADRLLDREKLGTTGFGGGIAVPHARIAGIDSVRGIFARMPRGIEFAAVDELPVDLVFMLLSPEEAGAEHLKALARVSRRLRDRPLVEKLRGAGSPDAIYALLTGIDTRDAA